MVIVLITIGIEMRNQDPLTKYQKRENLTRSALARKLGFSKGFMSLYFNGDRNIGVKSAIRVSEITGIPLIELLRIDSRKRAS